MDQTATESHDQNRTLKTDDGREVPVAKTYEQGQLLMEWKSPARFFRQKSREYFTTIATIVFLLEVILFFIEEYMLMLVVFAVAFVAYVLSTVPPEEVEHKITTFGLETYNRRYAWYELYEFWFEEKADTTLLTILTRLQYPVRIHILLGDADKEHVKKLLQDYLPYKSTPTYTLTDRMARWLNRKIPLENIS